MKVNPRIGPVSILTGYSTRKSLKEYLIYFFNFLIKFKKTISFSSLNFYGGHPGVTKNLIVGLQKIGHKYNYNPSTISLNEICIVLSGIDTLRYAIDQKKHGNIKLLIAGPNVVTVPSEADYLIASRQVDICLTPSTWVKELYAAISPELNNRLTVWPAGVDINYWCPSDLVKKENYNRKKYLLYIKGVKGEKLAKGYIKEFNRIGVAYKVITYGRYSPAKYKSLLNESSLMIVLGGTESQGLAFAEAWAMNVPTFIHRVDSWESPSGIRYKAEAAPYLSQDTGIYFNDMEDLFTLLNNFNSNELKYSPREWVLHNMTDEVCARELLEKIQRIRE